MGWGDAISKVSGILDGLLGLSPEQRKIKLRNKIDKLEKERDDILKEKVTVDRAKRLNVVDGMLRELRKKAANE